MADYSGHVDPWSYSFNPEAPRYCYWWTYKDFSDSGPKVEVPLEFLPMLVDLYYANASKTWASTPVRKLKVRWNPMSKRLWTELFPVSDSDTKKWLKSHGYQLRVCTHQDTDKMYHGEICRNCSKYRVKGKGWR
jgi:hypothetical protein